MPNVNIMIEYEKVIDSAKDERPIQTFISQNPEIISQIQYGGKGNWVFPKPKFGCEYVPDFIICTEDSAGFHWVLVELENPTYNALRKDGQQTAHLSNAIKQINDWRIWLRKNVAYVRDELSFVDLNAECIAIIIIGRRKLIYPNQREIYRELSNDKLRVMTYDRLTLKL